MILSVRQWRRACEISQRDIAKQLGVHVNTYAAWEASPEKISITNAEKLAQIFNVSIEDIKFKEA